MLDYYQRGLSSIDADIEVIKEANMLWEEWRSLLQALWRARRPSEEGQGLVEYALILVLVVLIVVVLVSFLGPWVGNVYSNVVHNL
jgi:pilus assembly protein Flp/PilA